MLSRVDRLRGEMAARDLDGFLVTDLLNVRYLSGFTGSFAAVLVTREDAVIITDFRYVEQAQSECPGLTLEMVESHWVIGAQRTIEKYDVKRLGLESHSLSYHDWVELTSVPTGVTFVPQEDLVATLRHVKEPVELDLIRKAAEIADQGYEYIVDRIKPGITEREIALDLEYFMRKQGAEAEAFESIVASGYRSALPHGKASDRKIGKGEFILLDFGAKYEGYHSDITRTVVIGEADGRQSEVYGIVEEAQARAIAAIHPGVRGSDVDGIARDYIADHGYGAHFGHSLGHGLGLDVHDGRILAQRSEIVLEPGMVVTVEPGIYIPGWGGVRTEDDVLVTDSGAEVLTHAPKTLSITGA